MQADFRAIVVIPCYKHADTLAHVLDGLKPSGLPVVVIDDGNEPETRKVLERLAGERDEMNLVHHEVNRGKGAAVTTGIRYAAEHGFTHALQVDADGQHDLTCVAQLLEAAQRAPDVLWSARPVYDKSIPKKRLIGRYVTHVWVWIETLSLDIVDSMCGFRVYPVAQTMQILDRHHLGQFMDFDTEILVRLYWQGLDIRFIPCRVIYPENGHSNFRLWEDNVRISKMHTRLVVESPLHWPSRIARVFRRNSSDSQTHWMQIKERRGLMGMKCLWWLYRWGGRTLFSLISLPVTAVFYLTGSQARQASRKFLSRVESRQRELGRNVELLSGIRHFQAFTMGVLDRLAAWAGDLTFGKDIDFADEESRRLMSEPPADGRGKLVLVSHLGVAEATRALVQHDLAIPVWALVYDRHAPRFKAMLDELDPEASRYVIAIDRLGIETTSQLEDAVNRGEWVAIAADRTPDEELSRTTRTVCVPFLGHEAQFPVGPFVLASLLKCEVVTLFVVRNRGKLFIHARSFVPQVRFSRNNREEVLADLVRRWVSVLEDQAIEHPYQWFNFYDFWKEEDRS